jgi:hypothetical protein
MSAVCRIERRTETPTITRMQELQANRLADGRIELIVTDSSLKTLGKGRWHTERVFMTLDDDAKAQLRAALS